MAAGGAMALPADAPAPPGLEHSEASVFEPGAGRSGGVGAEPSPGSPGVPPASPASPLDKATYQYMYNQLLFQYSTEVPFLRHQVLELTGKLAELDKWKLQTTSLVRDLRDQHRAIRRKICEDPPVPAVLERATSEAQRSPSGADAVASSARSIGAARSAPPSSTPPPAPGTSLLTMKAGIPDSAPLDFDMGTGLKVYKTKMQDGQVAMRAEWKVNHFSTKLRGALGRPVVSAPFDMWCFSEIRLMITPEVLESGNNNIGPLGPRSSRKEKEQFSKMVTDGPLFACLTLQVPNSHKVNLRYVLHVGGKCSAMYECDFSNTPIDNRGAFRAADGAAICNWLQETKDSSLTVGVEMLAPAELDAGATEPPAEAKDEEMLFKDPGALPGLVPAAPFEMEMTDDSRA